MEFAGYGGNDPYLSSQGRSKWGTGLDSQGAGRPLGRRVAQNTKASRVQHGREPGPGFLGPRLALPLRPTPGSVGPGGGGWKEATDHMSKYLKYFKAVSQADRHKENTLHPPTLTHTLLNDLEGQV